MNGRRLIRSGTVSRVGDGCALIDVSVPCTCCRVGCCGARPWSGAASIEIENVGHATIGRGAEVALSISAGALARSSVRLFGPAIAWALCFALLAPAGWPAAIVGGVGLALALASGRALAVRSTDNLGIEVLAPSQLVQEVR